MTKKKTNRVAEGLLDALIGDHAAAGIRSLGRKGVTRDIQLQQDLFIKDFISDATASLAAGIRGGFVDPKIRGGTTAADKDQARKDQDVNGPGSSATDPSIYTDIKPGEKSTPPATATQMSSNVASSTSTASSPSTTTRGTAGPTSAQSTVAAAKQFNKGVTAAQSANADKRTANDALRASANAALAKPAFQQTASDRVAIQKARQAGLVKESYDKLNALFESIFEATGGQSIAAYMTSWFNKYMKGTEWLSHKNQVYPIIQNIEDTYKKDKGSKAIKQLAQAAFAISRIAGIKPAGAQDIKDPSQEPDKPQVNVKQVAKAISQMPLTDLEELKKLIDALIKQAQTNDQAKTNQPGNAALGAQTAANLLPAPTVPNKSPGIGQGGIGITKESRRPRR